MSPLWRDEVGVYLTPRRVCMVRVKRGLRAMLEREVIHEISETSGSWEGALSLYERQLATNGWADAGIRVVVANHWARYCIVPWSDQLSAPADRLALARELLSAIFGEMSEWTVTLSAAPPGASTLASAMPSGLWNSLKEITAVSRQRLIAVQPHLVAAFNTWRSTLPGDSAAWFVTVEEGSLAALRLSTHGIDRVHAVRIGVDWARELKRLQTFGRLARSSPADGRVYVDLPLSLRALRPQGVADLEWLDDPHPPLTTLHQLEYLRRKSA